MRKQVKTVIVVTAYGRDNDFHKKNERIIGVYTSTTKAVAGAKADGLTNWQTYCLNGMGAFCLLDRSIANHKGGDMWQVECDKEIDPFVVSSYMFKTYNLD